MPLSFNPFATAGGQFYTQPRTRTMAATAKKKKPPKWRNRSAPWMQTAPTGDPYRVRGTDRELADPTHVTYPDWDPQGIYLSDPANTTPAPYATAAEAAAAPFDYTAALRNDPAFKRFLDALGGERENEITTAGQAISTAFGRFGGDVNRWRQMLAAAQFDQDPILNAINWDAASAISSGATPYGATTLSQLEKSHALRQAESDAALGARGIYRSGEQGWRTDQELQEYTRGQDAAANALLEMLSGVESSFLQSETDRTNREAQAWIDAYNRALEADAEVDRTPEEAVAPVAPTSTAPTQPTGGIDWTAAIAAVGKQPGKGKKGRAAYPGRKSPAGGRARRKTWKGSGHMPPGR